MGNLTVAVLGKQGYCNALGKKGTSTDITLYDLKNGKDTIIFVEPTSYPERLAPLFYACSIAKKAIVVIDELNSTLGEILVMLQCCEVSNGYFVLLNYISKDKIEPLVRGTLLENYKFVDDDQTALKELLLTKAAQTKSSESINEKHPSGTVPVDHAFNVKGIGTVILGVVANGVIQNHDTMNVLPGTKTTQIRSIQKHDHNFEFAIQGDRVGLALKNVKVDDVDRGRVLTNDTTIIASKMITAHALLVNYWSTPLKTGMVLHLGHWMQFLNCKVEAVNDEKNWRRPILTLRLEKEIVHRHGDIAILMHLEGGKLRVTGTIELP